MQKEKSENLNFLDALKELKDTIKEGMDPLRDLRDIKDNTRAINEKLSEHTTKLTLIDQHLISIKDTGKIQNEKLSTILTEFQDVKHKYSLFSFIMGIVKFTWSDITSHYFWITKEIRELHVLRYLL